MEMKNPGHRAIVFMPHTSQKDGVSPLFLEEILFRPAAAWTIQALFDAGVEQFFLVCGDSIRQAAIACFPENAKLTVVDEENPAEQLTAFLREAAGMVFVLTRPVYLSAAGAKLLTGGDPLPKNGIPGGIFRLQGQDLAEALEGGQDFRVAIEHLGQQMFRPFRPEALPRMIPLGGRDDLQEAQAAGRREIISGHLDAGVRILDPGAVYIEPRAKIGAGTLLLPGTILRGGTVIGKHCEIGPNTMITNCTVGDCTTVNASQCYESTIGAFCKLGPFAYVRPGCTVSDHVKLGDFVEVKNSVLGEGVKISHLTYVGDSDIGPDVNLGCGTVTVNYDGITKARTVVGAGAFVGCNTNLVAPVTVGEGAYIAAGSTITRDVPPGSLAIARAQQTTKQQWAAKRRKKQTGIPEKQEE